MSTQADRTRAGRTALTVVGVVVAQEKVEQGDGIGLVVVSDAVRRCRCLQAYADCAGAGDRAGWRRAAGTTGMAAARGRYGSRGRWPRRMALARRHHRQGPCAFPASVIPEPALRAIELGESGLRGSCVVAFCAGGAGVAA